VNIPAIQVLDYRTRCCGASLDRIRRQLKLVETSMHHCLFVHPRKVERHSGSNQRPTLLHQFQTLQHIPAIKLRIPTRSDSAAHWIPLASLCGFILTLVWRPFSLMSSESSRDGTDRSIELSQPYFSSRTRPYRTVKPSIYRSVKMTWRRTGRRRWNGCSSTRGRHHLTSTASFGLMPSEGCEPTSENEEPWKTPLPS
jgi:hypothetical protein